jgi:NAD(P)H-hydrate epimerase
MKVFTAQQMRDFDSAATARYGIPSIVLMENAALRVIEFLAHHFGPLRGRNILILCGKGNNGGDGLTIARHLLHSGARLTVALAASPADYKGDAQINYEILRHAVADNDDGCRLIEITETFNWRGLGETDIILDALLGTGFHGEVREGAIKQALQWLQRAAAAKPAPHVVAVDVPSALNSDTGEAAAEAVLAAATVTLAAPKRGLFLSDGIELCGEIWVGSIGTPPAQMQATVTGCECITHDLARGLLPQRPIDSHKGNAGRVVLCGGSYGMSGAPTLAARAALRCGAGLAIACVPDKILPILATSFLEATSHALPNDEHGSLVEAAADKMAGYWDKANVVALGPGLSRTDGALNFARRVVRECPHPLVIDADALYALRAIAAEVKAREAPTVLTPHPGEMGELMQMEIKAVQKDRIGTALACAEKYGAVVVLKGSRSIVALPDGRAFINLTGNSGMATGGAGDVLTGTIAGLAAQLKDVVAATLLGVYAHGLAGDIEYATKGYGLIAGDIAGALPQALEMLRYDEDDTMSLCRRLR